MVQRVLGWKAFLPLALNNSRMLHDFPIFLPEITEGHQISQLFGTVFLLFLLFLKPKSATTMTPKYYFCKHQPIQIFSLFLLKILGHIITELSMNVLGTDLHKLPSCRMPKWLWCSCYGAPTLKRTHTHKIHFPTWLSTSNSNKSYASIHVGKRKEQYMRAVHFPWKEKVTIKKEE